MFFEADRTAKHFLLSHVPNFKDNKTSSPSKLFLFFHDLLMIQKSKLHRRIFEKHRLPA